MATETAEQRKDRAKMSPYRGPQHQPALLEDLRGSPEPRTRRKTIG